MMANIELKEEKNEVKTISDLEDDSLLFIFSLLNIHDRTRCERVCQRWNNLIIHSWASTKSLVLQTSKQKYCEVSFPMNKEIFNNATFHKILKKCPNLKSIDLKQPFHFNEKSCEIIGECCPDLEKLILRQTAFSNNSVAMIGKVCHKLKSIDLSYCRNISERSLWELFHSRPDMECVSLSEVKNITGKCLHLLNAPSYLNLSGSSSNCSEALSKLSKNCSQSLKTLYAPWINMVGLKIICKTFPNLEFLRVDMSTEVHNVSSIGVRLLGNLTKLQVLRLFTRLDDGALLVIMKSFPDLRELSLYDNYILTASSVASLPKYCKNLRTLSFEGSKISDDFAQALAHHKKLTVLKFSTCFTTDGGAMYILKHSTSLEFLSINQCCGISNETILYAWDLVYQGLVSKDLLIEYNFKQIKVNEYATREECKKFVEIEKYHHEFNHEYSEYGYYFEGEYYDGIVR